MDKKVKDLLTGLAVQDNSTLKALAMCLLVLNENGNADNCDVDFTEDDYIKLVLKVFDVQKFCVAHLTYEEQVLAALKFAVVTGSVETVLNTNAESLAWEIDWIGVEQLDRVASDFYARRWVE